jgi:wyosine [tRNA(Phe)-imidazoG37] synthetase (radical SAM superfamily)
MSTGLHSVVYGPFKSPQLGITLGINPIPGPKSDCPKDCEVCATGSPDAEPIVSRPDKPPSAGVVVTGAARRIIGLSKAGEKLAALLVAGDHEPTLHPNFLEITENLRDLRGKWFPKTPLCVAVRTPHVETRDLVHALQIYDKPLLRFSWGSARTFTAMTKGTPAEYKTLVEVGAALDRLVVDACFVAENSTDKELSAFIRKLEELHPTEVLVGTVGAGARGGQKPLTESRLEKIAATIGEKGGFPARAHSAEKQVA